MQKRNVKQSVARKSPTQRKQLKRTRIRSKKIEEHSNIILKYRQIASKKARLTENVISLFNKRASEFREKASNEKDITERNYLMQIAIKYGEAAASLKVHRK